MVATEPLVQMGVSPAEYLELPLRAHDLLRGVRLHDVSVVDLPGGGAGRTIADIRAIDSSAEPSSIAQALFGLRRVLGRVFGWDRAQMRPEDSLMSHLSASDRAESQVPPGTRQGSFRAVYQFSNEALSEIRNATVQGYICFALVPKANGYRLYFAVYVRPVSWITQPYLLAIEPFRRILYPAMLRRIRQGWLAAYGHTDGRGQAAC
jgi:hypothetical protein